MKTIVQNFVKYRSKEVIDACEYKPGMEDGFITRYYDDENVDPDGTIYTSGLIGEHEVEVPYIIGEERRKVLLGDGYYILKNEEGEIYALHKKQFDEQFELITK